MQPNITGPSIFELVQRTKKFVRFELAHAGVAVAIFFGIFLILEPWNYHSGSAEDRPYWMVGPPLIYFMVDLLLGLMLHFGNVNELRPKTCKLWMILQVGNLIQLTLLGFFMIWEIEFVDYSYLKLIAALLVLYLYKSYRISIMQKLVQDMRARCSIVSSFGGNAVSSRSHQIVSEQTLRPTFTISVQQPEAAAVLGGNVKLESSA
ncbi:hypothetical protein Ocin01_00774 [Orchesella cincta]|uniref:Transmembrane protein n=1 Tax=Orchesella cincta TaxID=48709 RepID=A0A1D2NL25_ORCCI|nr:hypothetical protein Ocin01_00774 [Orchesella cincta]